ncbi:DUF535 family protein [Helicobacter felis]|uniref:DUF535 family protein n=2 Tax=Helicobacter felis TaxID=214 RepID=UPI001F4440B6|nr:DUF535 family protein [Helicobacter felis]
MWRFFPNLCKTNCLRALKALQWFAQRDRDLHIKIFSLCSLDDMVLWKQMVAKLEIWLQQNGINIATFVSLIPKGNPFYRFEEIYHMFADARLTHAEHIEWVIFNLKFLENLQVRTESGCRDFLDLQQVRFHTLKDTTGGGGEYHFCLKTMRGFTYQEGFLWLEISFAKENTSKRLYASPLCITPQSDLLITSVKGETLVKGEAQVDQECIRFLTKHCCCHPAAFLVELQKILTRILGLNKTLGIPNAAQVSYVRYAGRRRLVRDYDDFFMKRGADEVDLVEIGGRTYYNLPHAHRDITYYPQKKRSIRKKRWQLLDTIEENFKNMLHRHD